MLDRKKNDNNHIWVGDVHFFMFTSLCFELLIFSNKTILPKTPNLRNSIVLVLIANE